MYSPYKKAKCLSQFEILDLIRDMGIWRYGATIGVNAWKPWIQLFPCKNINCFDKLKICYFLYLPMGLTNSIYFICISFKLIVKRVHQLILFTGYRIYQFLNFFDEDCEEWGLWGILGLTINTSAAEAESPQQQQVFYHKT